MDAAATLQKEFKEFRSRLKLISVYSMISNMCVLALPIFMLNTFRTVIPSENMASLFGFYGFAAMLLIAMGIFEAARTILASRNAARFEANLSGIVLTGELNRQHDPKPLTFQDLTQVKNVVGGGAMMSLFDLPTVPIFTGILFLIHPALGFTVVVGIILMAWLGIAADRATAPFINISQDAQRDAGKALSQHFQMQEYVRSQGLFREALSDWGRSQRKSLKIMLEMTNTTSVHGGIAKSARMIFQITLILVGAILVLQGDASIIVVFAASIIGGRALAPIDGVIGNWRTLRQGYEAYKRLKGRMEDLVIPNERTPLPPPDGQVLFQRVTYVPKPGAPPILRAVAFGIEPGQSLAIIGPSGAGKSTIARLLVGYLEPSVGVVKLDGQDLKAWDPIARGHHIGYIPQEVSFFEATIQENIASLRRDDPKEWAVDAAKRAGVHDLILGMPEGYDTPMSKAGFWPSGGQAQLIALARAFYGDPRLLVLDEPNAALDQGGEQTLHRAIERAKADGITVVVITQRPSLLRFMDLVLILQGGNVKDFGPREKVMDGQKVRAVPDKKTADTDKEPAAEAPPNPANSQSEAQQGTTG